MTTKSKPRLLSKNCSVCGAYKTGSAYYPTKSKFFRDGLLTICRECLREQVDQSNWHEVDKLCQWADYPFYPDAWDKLYRELDDRALDAYVRAFTASEEYETLDWSIVHKEWQTAIESGDYREKVPEISDHLYGELRTLWGDDYHRDELAYMDRFYKGLCESHNIITEIQRDNARNLAKLSVRISQRISKGMEVDKDIRSYSELMKTGGFTQENIRNMSDFESVGEVMAYLERTGWRNPYYNGAPQDQVDETIANIQNFLRRIVMGESNLRETVEQRLSGMGIATAATFDLTDSDMEAYDNEGYEEIDLAPTGDEEEEFDA